MEDLDIRYLTAFRSRYARWLWRVLEFDGLHKNLFNLLYDTEFTWTIPMDENRAMDGVYMRDRFCYETGDHLPDGWRDWPCSVLEMLGSLAFTMEESFLYDPDSDTSAATWFWEMLDNCGLGYFDDTGWANGTMKRRVLDILERDYEPDGRGGFFPLRNPPEDQRNVEIWFQMNAYVAENML